MNIVTRLNNLYGKVKKGWTTEEVLDDIDSIIGDIESRTCENCEYDYCNFIKCKKCITRPTIEYYDEKEDGQFLKVDKDFSCNRFKRKQNG